MSGSIVGWCEANNTNFLALDLEKLQGFHEAFEADALDWLDPRGAAERRTSFGGTSSGEIARQVAALRVWLA